eukprot:CAMPEP_0184988670 /NCGR_PEP_ID=MMETSP1098-20130426/25069_1 /TAXON_ID=89044 /ORGANISM="Spumella elongata, Strain CCAP 955/1" /LENGTH=81 /DNA_ID=CAMNT_0027513481 /DNA_START=37 /DNA_END=282 /DNA_ORIENTATION=+
MVFKGQDAWRKHPLLTGCHKTPFPHFGLAVKIFAGYLVVSAYFKHIHAPPADTYKPTFKYYTDNTGALVKVDLVKSHDDHH